MNSYYQSITIIDTSDDADGSARRIDAGCEISLGEPWAVRRRSRRIDVDQAVRFRTVDSRVSVIGVVRNLSLGGVFIEAPLIPPPGALLALGFVVQHDGGRRVLRSMGRVAWCRTHAGQRGFGLRFVEPKREVLACISALIRDCFVSAGL